MSEPTAVKPGGSDSLLPWLLGGLVAGAIMLGLLVAAYAIGYHRGERHGGGSSAAASTAVTTTSTTAATTATGAASPSTIGPVTVTPALVARGKTLFTADGCVACHSLTGSAGAGPALNGLAGSEVTLDDGTTVEADDAYLVRSLVDSDAEIVKGYRGGVMPAAVASYGLDKKPDDIRALVAFMKSQE